MFCKLANIHEVMMRPDEATENYSPAELGSVKMRAKTVVSMTPTYEVRTLQLARPTLGFSQRAKSELSR